MLFNESFWVAFSIILFVVLVFKYTRKALNELLCAKISLIEEKISLSDSIRIEAEKTLTEHINMLNNVHIKAEEIISTAKEEILHLKSLNEEKIINMILAKKFSTTQKLNNDEDEAIYQLRVKIIDLSVRACGSLISDNNHLYQSNDLLVWNALKNAKL